MRGPTTCDGQQNTKRLNLAHTSLVSTVCVDCHGESSDKVGVGVRMGVGAVTVGGAVAVAVITALDEACGNDVWFMCDGNLQAHDGARVWWSQQRHCL